MGGGDRAGKGVHWLKGLNMVDLSLLLGRWSLPHSKGEDGHGNGMLVWESLSMVDCTWGLGDKIQHL